MSRRLRAKYESLSDDLRTRRRILIAFSGGCDSTFLLATARQLLGKESVLAVTAVSASLAERERRDAERLVAQLDVHHRFLNTEEVSNPSYQANPSNRCFFCKDELFGKLSPIALENNMALVDGFNASDRSDVRPGMVAAKQWKIVHPLDDADFSKLDIRVLSRWMQLPTWNKPASPCLSSRIPYGTAVTETILRQVEKAEDAVRSEGFRVVRVRHYGTEARIEVPLKDINRLTEPTLWQRVVLHVKRSGYDNVVADPSGFQTGRLNK